MRGFIVVACGAAVRYTGAPMPGLPPRPWLLALALLGAPLHAAEEATGALAAVLGVQVVAEQPASAKPSGSADRRW